MGVVHTCFYGIIALTEERKKGDQAIKDILLSTHPAFARLKEVVRIPYRVMFYSLSELDQLLSARRFEKDEFPFDDSIHDWQNKHEKYGIIVRKHIFDDDGRLKVITPEEWDDSWIDKYELAKQSVVDDDEIPF